MSISGIVLLSAGAALILASQKQNTVALSTTEAEYICLSDIAHEVKWLQNLFMEVGYPQHTLTVVYGDNLGALAITENPCYHKRTKHFDIKHHYIHEQIALWPK